MSLEALLAPIKAADRRVLEYYTRVSEGVRDSWLYVGCAVMSLCGAVGEHSVVEFFPSYGIDEPMVALARSSTSLVISSMLIIDTLILTDQLMKSYLLPTGGHHSDSPTIKRCKKFNRFVRLPLFVGGSFLLGKAVSDVVSHFTHGGPLDDLEYTISGGIGCLLTASSMYLKDRDPKLLNKKPFWKSAYEKIKAGIKSLAPVPQLQPVPVRKYETIDIHVQTE